MLAGEYCNRDVAIVGKTDSVLKAAKLMRELHIGDVIVVDAINGERVPVGILSDRDIVIGVLAEEIDINFVLLEDVMSYKLVVAQEDDDMMSVIKRMRVNGIRRMPIVNKNGGLIGILSVDDILDIIAEQIMDIEQLIYNEQSKERKLRPPLAGNSINRL